MTGRLRAALRSAARVVATVLVVAMGLSVLQVLAVRFVTPPATPTMLARAWEDGAWPTVRPLPLEELGSAGPRAIVASEDGRFFLHGGFDIESICDAVREAADGGSLRGGSTISQQTAKNLFLWQGRSWIRKGLEVWYTLWLELLVPKERILELYLTVAETGQGVFGLEAAAWHWYGRPARKLNWNQAGRIAGILPSPRTRSVKGQAATERARWVKDNQVPFPGDPGYDRLVTTWREGGWGPLRCF